MFQIFGIAGIFCSQLQGNSENSKKTKRLNKEEFKKQLIESRTINSAIETDDLNELAEKVEKSEDADMIKQCEEILRTKRKGIISVAQREKFIQMASKLKIHKSTIIFKINVFQLIQKHHKLMKSLVTLTFLKNYLRTLSKSAKKIQGSLKKVKVICLGKPF